MLTGACSRCGAPFSIPDQWDAVGVAPPATPTCGCWPRAAATTTTTVVPSFSLVDPTGMIAEVTRIYLVWVRGAGGGRLRARDAMAQIGDALGLPEER